MGKESGFSNPTADLWSTMGSRGRQPLVVVLAEDVPANPSRLTSRRCAAALPFAGKYRLIDFPLSNCVNSEMESVGVIAQYQPRSLYEHLAYGQPWDLNRPGEGLTLLCPYQAGGEMRWYTGTANAIYQNQDFLRESQSEEVLILAGDEIYSTDFNVLVAQHRETRADLTVAVSAVGAHAPVRQVNVQVGPGGRVCGLRTRDGDATGQLAAMGVMLFSTRLLLRRLEEDARDPASTHDLLRDVVPRMVRAQDAVMVYLYTGYWHDLQSAPDYWQASMDLLSEKPGLNLQDRAWPIRTRSEVRPPTRISAGAKISHSLVCEGCIVDGTVEYSVLSPGVCVAPGATVRNSVVMHNTSVEERALVENAILDMDVTVGPQARVGQAPRHAPTVGAPAPNRIAIVSKGTRVPECDIIHPEPLGDDWLLSTRLQGTPSERLNAA